MSTSWTHIYMQLLSCSLSTYYRFYFLYFFLFSTPQPRSNFPPIPSHNKKPMNIIDCAFLNTIKITGGCFKLICIFSLRVVASVIFWIFFFLLFARKNNQYGVTKMTWQNVIRHFCVFIKDKASEFGREERKRLKRSERIYTE